MDSRHPLPHKSTTASPHGTEGPLDARPPRPKAGHVAPAVGRQDQRDPEEQAARREVVLNLERLFARLGLDYEAVRGTDGAPDVATAINHILSYIMKREVAHGTREIRSLDDLRRCETELLRILDGREDLPDWKPSGDARSDDLFAVD